ncbi:gustatory and pheromone receptor 39a-like [Haematobia irritans]|uniref:gustatory and pheromone receptor 39a-like n=1 Tax=Haematobia irritans TaxID=7368 RepID=UPI003F50900A
MSSVRYLHFHIKTLQLFGLMCCTYSHNDGGVKLIVTKKHGLQALATLVLVYITFINMSICGFIFANELYFEEYNRTGDQFFIIHFQCSCLLQLFVYGYCYVKREDNLRFIQAILKFQHECKGLKKINTTHNGLYGAYFSICLLCSCVYVTVFFKQTLFTAIAYSLVFVTSTWTAGIVILMHLSVVKVMEVALKYLNKQLEIVSIHPQAIEIKTLQRLLTKRIELLAICYGGINQHFGFLLLVIIAFIAITAASGPFYVLSLLSRKPPLNVSILAVVIVTFTCFTWNIPCIMIFLAISACNGVTREASRSIQILFRMNVENPKVLKIVSMTTMGSIKDDLLILLEKQSNQLKEHYTCIHITDATVGLHLKNAHPVFKRKLRSEIAA